MAYKFSELTPFLNGKYEVLLSAYKNLRFSVPMIKYITIDATNEANLPGISYAEYGTTELWRAILHANGLSDPINDVIVGTRLGIPEQGALIQYLTRALEQQGVVTI